MYIGKIPIQWTLQGQSQANLYGDVCILQITHVHFNEYF